MPTSTAELSVPPMDQHPPDTARAAFALGCFWGPDALFGALDGVVRTCVGYAGGTTAAPTYEAIGDHIETVRVEYDPDRCTYDDLLDVFWDAHNPTRAPFKRQYQPALFPYTEAQAERARATRDAAAARHDEALTTEIIAEPAFHRAERYHQKHSLRHYDALMDPLRTLYPADDAFVDSPAVTLLNGYAGGHRAPARLADDRSRLGLPDTMFEALRTIAERRSA